ncbi:MAG: ABC transporter ATP-binding protein/permease [Lachnospiraceae bacterium]|nr:ABC transporter ATP-binding protein/permease [Lachnospiraceae bacterium]
MMKTFFAHLRGNICIFFVTLLVGIWYSANSVLIPVLAGELITAVVNDLSSAAGIILLYLGIYLVQLILCQVDTFMAGKFKIRQRVTMRDRAYEAYSGGKSAVSREETASFVSFLNNDLPAVVEQYFAGTIDITKCVCLILFSAVSILSIHWVLALEIFLFSVMIVCFPSLLKGRGNRARKAVSEAMSWYNARLQSFLGGLPVLKSYGYRSRSAAFMNRSNQKIAVRESRQLQCQIAVYGTSAFLQLFKDGLLLITSVLLVARGEIAIGSLVTVLQLASLLAAPVEVLAYLRHARNEVGSLLKRYEEILEGDGQKNAGIAVTDGEKQGNRFMSGDQKHGKKEETPFFGAGHSEGDKDIDEEFHELRVKDLSYIVNGISILKNINHTFRAGEKYLITGENGSGKTTLVRFLSRTLEQPTAGETYEDDGDGTTFHDSSDWPVGDDNKSGTAFHNKRGGAIFYNETAADKMPDSVYYKHICPVFQEPYLFCMTFRENILLGRDIPETVYREVTERLKLDYLLRRYEGQEISPEIVEQLSGGEKQRVALARAMVGRPDLYLSYEVTSALDEKNAENVERILLEEDAMVIMISHKPSGRLMERYTEHLVMEEGRLMKCQADI